MKITMPHSASGFIRLAAAGALTLAGLFMPGAITPGLAGAQASPIAQRIVAAGGVITEIIYALGQQDRLVGVDTTSQFPPEALKSKTGIGYVRALSAEGVLSLRPDLVLAIEGAGPPDALRLLGEARIEVATLPEDMTEVGVLTRIRRVGERIGAAAAAEALAKDVEAKFLTVAKERAGLTQKKRVLFVLSLQNGRVLVGGRNSSAAAIIALAGAVNAAEAVDGFKPLSDEGLIKAAPDIILMMQRSGHAAKPEEVFALPAFQAIPAAKSRAMISMDALFLLGFGPRTPDAARALMRKIYPEGIPVVGNRAASGVGPSQP